MSESTGFDVLIVGAGPAGTAAAIRAAGKGMKVALVEKAEFPRDLPGEALHPDVDPLFVQLGVAGAVADCGFIRYPGWIEERAGERDFIPFLDASGRMLFGYQAWRADLDAVLLAEASRLGVQVFQPAQGIDVLIAAGRVVGLKMDGLKMDGLKMVGLQIDSQQLFGRFVIDATGRSRWLAHKLRLRIQAVSARLVARYAYFTEDPGLGVIPIFREDSNGWIWMARVRTDCCQYVHLALAAGSELPTLAPPFNGLQPIARLRGADVTWRVVPECAGAGYFLCGDAAATLDPAASSGTSRALAAGMKAADLISQVHAGDIDEPAAALSYRGWLIGEFTLQATLLGERHAGLANAPGWLGDLKKHLASLQTEDYDASYASAFPREGM